MERTTIRSFAKRLNGGLSRGSSAALAHFMGVPVKTVRAWLLDPDDPSRRNMSKTAIRLMATFQILDAAGLLDKTLLAAVTRVEDLLQGDAERLREVVVRLSAEPTQSSEDDVDDDD